MIVKRIPAGIYAANCYIIMDESTKEGAVIDPGGDGEDLVQCIKELGADVKFILLTHGHSDHTGAVGLLKETFNVSAHIHKSDGQFIENGEFMFGPLTYKGKNVPLDMDVVEGEVFSVGKFIINCIETPGHSPGGICYMIEDKLFSGDTLFLRSIGRTDLMGGDYDTLIEKIKNKLLILGDNITVFPGHGASTSIKYERLHNPFL